MNRLWHIIDKSRTLYNNVILELRRNVVQLFVILLSSFCTQGLKAQTQAFPVTVLTQFVPPAPINFSDYANSNRINGPLRVQLVLNDFTIGNREVRLKLFFEGQGITFESNDNVSGAPALFLNGGVPINLQDADLAPYFLFNNINGISPAMYANSIPEGSYQFCFEVYDVLTNRRLSARSCATAIVFQNDPPFLVLPQRDQEIRHMNPQNIVFQWTPRHINVSNVDYELSIVEVWDNRVDPQTAFLSAPPVFQTTTSTTTFVYGPSAPLLLPNKVYAWRVRAKAKQGAEAIGLFKNQGHSEIFSFRYTSPCDLPTAIAVEVKGAHQVNLSWDDFTTDIPKFNIRYRKKGSATDWFYSRTSTNWVTLWDLRADTTYEYQLNKACQISESAWSPAAYFTTTIEEDIATLANCGIPPEIDLVNKTPLPFLEKGDAFLAGDFNIKVLEVSGAEGRFTGKGYVTIPYLESIKVSVTFTNVLINTDKQLAEGLVVTTYDESLKNIVDVDEVIDTVGDIIETTGDIFQGDANDLKEIPINFDVETKDIEVKDGEIIITNPETGATVTEILTDDTVIIDKSGDVYHVDADGTVTKGGKKDPGGAVNSGNVAGVNTKGDLEALTAPDIQITFSGTGIYGFDAIPEQEKVQLTPHYTSIKTLEGEPYVLTHQAVPNKGETTLTAHLELKGTTYKAADVIFKTKQGEQLDTKITNATTIELTLKGHYSFENEIIYAVVPSRTEENKQLTAGAFQLWHLTERAVNVKLVAVNGAQIPNQVYTDVAKIFSKGVTAVNVEPYDKGLTLNTELFGENGLDIGDSPWLKAYNAEQKEVISAFKNLGSQSKSTYYVFVFQDLKTSANIAGFMPLQRQYGFLFSNKTAVTTTEGKGNLAKTLAHEIGHGVFALQHPFTALQTTEGATDWLMDYGTGVTLSHLDWMQMHDPKLKFYVFQDEEDGEFAGSYIITPDFDISFIQNTSTFHVNKENESIVEGVLPGFVLKKRGEQVFYQWEDGKYRNKSNFDDVYAHPKKRILADHQKVILFYNTKNECGLKKYIPLLYRNIKAYGLDAKGLLNAIEANNEKAKTIPCARQIVNEVSSEWHESGVTPIDCSVANIQSTLQENLENVNKINTQTSANEVTRILQENYTACLFESIGLDQRILLLNILLNDDIKDDAVWEFSEGVLSLGDTFYVGKLLLSVAIEDRVAFLKRGVMTNNHRWLRVLYEYGAGIGSTSIGNDVMFDEIAKIYITLGGWFVNNMESFSDENIMTLNHSLKFDDVGTFEAFSYSPGQQPFILGAANKEKTLHTSSQAETVVYNTRSRILENGRVFLSNSYKVLDLKTYISKPGETPGRSGYFEYKQSYHPFEPIVVIYGDRDTPFHIEAGQEIVVPAIVALAYQRTLMENFSDEVLRELGNYAMIVGGIASIPFTGGASLAGVASVIAVGGAAVASIDLVVQDKVDRNSELYKNWDQFYMVYSMLDAGVGGASLGLASYKALRNIKLVESYNRFNAAFKAARGVGKDALRKDFDEFRKILGRRVGTTSTKLLSELTEANKNIYDDFVNAGLSHTDDGKQIRFFDNSNNEIAVLTNEGLIPNKWLGTYRADEVIKTESGYWIVKKGEVYGIDLGFKEVNHRTFTADFVNNYHQGIGNHAPYKAGWPVNERYLTRGDKIYIVEYKNGGNPSPGGWGSLRSITEVKELRNKLSVLEEWKNTNVDELVVREYTVKADAKLRVRDGVVGPLQETSGLNKGDVYWGGGQQYEFIDNIRGNEWKKYIAVVDPNGIPLKLYSKGELLSSLKAKLGNKLNDTQWQAFKANFADDIDLLKIFDETPELVDSWKVAFDKGIDDLIRGNPDYLKVLDKFPFGTGKKSILDNATDAEWNQILSGKLVELPDPDPNLSKALKEKFGSRTQTSKKFGTDPTGKEFDAITDQYFVEHKALTSTNPMSQAKRTQMKYHMKACKTAGKDNYLIFEGVQNDDWVNRAVQYANDFQVNTKIEVNGVLVHDITF